MLIVKIDIVCVYLMFIFPNSKCQWSFSPLETEVYDLVDEAKINFYDFLNVSQDATQQDIRRSYRQLSRTMHPDKNKTKGAEENFRILVAMYEILKNKEKREIYDNVLAHGLPGSYLYVHRPLQKMSLLEASIIISFISTIGHFLFMWGAYVERRLTLDEMLPRIEKKLKKQKRRGQEEVSIQHVENLYINSTNPKPTVYDVLPILLVRKLYAFFVWLPNHFESRKEAKILLQKLEEDHIRQEEAILKRQQEELQRREEQKKLKKERNRIKREKMLEDQKLLVDAGPQPPVAFESPQAIEDLEAMYDEMTDEDFRKKKPKKEAWTEEDQSILAKLMTKYPGGTPERWLRISREMSRSVNEVTAKAKAVRSDFGAKAKYSAITQKTGKLLKNKHADKHYIPDEIITTDSCKEIAKKQINSEKLSDDDDSQSKVKRKQDSRDLKQSLNNQPTEIFGFPSRWEQNQQKLLEMALQQFPKSMEERWEKIANCIPGKTKEECIARYRFLAEKIQERRKPVKKLS